MVRIASLGVAVLVLAGLCSAGPLVCSFKGDIYDINLNTGQISNQNVAALPRNTYYLDIAYDLGNLYAVTAFGGSPGDSLVRVDPATAAMTPIGPVGLTMVEGDLAVDPTTHTLYAVESPYASNERLVRIDTATGAGTVVGNLPTPPGADYSGLAFTDSGDLYALDAYACKLLKLNKDDASVISTKSVSLTSAEFGGFAGMDYDPISGKTYVVAGLTPKLYTLDLATGTMTLVGNTGFGFHLIDGLVGLSITSPALYNPLPEPATLSLLCLGGLALAGRIARRRGRRG